MSYPVSQMSIDKPQKQCYDTASLFLKTKVYIFAQGYISQRLRTIRMTENRRALRRVSLLSILIAIAINFWIAELAQNAWAAQSPLLIRSISPDQPSTLIAQGKGLMRQNRGRSLAQEKLLARRAAKLDAYKKLLSASQWLTPHIESPHHVFQQDGFIQGASVLSEHINENQEVIIEIGLPISIKKTSQAKAIISQRTIIYPNSPVPHSMVPITRQDWSNFNY